MTEFKHRSQFDCVKEIERQSEEIRIVRFKNDGLRKSVYAVQEELELCQECLDLSNDNFGEQATQLVKVVADRDALQSDWNTQSSQLADCLEREDARVAERDAPCTRCAELESKLSATEDDHEGAVDTIFNLRARCEAAEKDAARIDWINRQDFDELCFTVFQDCPDDGKYGVSGDTEWSVGDNLRDAIDAAIAKEREA